MQVTFTLSVDSHDFATLAKVYEAIGGDPAITVTVDAEPTEMSEPPKKKLGRRAKARLDAPQVPHKAHADEAQAVDASLVAAPPEPPAESFPPIPKNAVRAVLRVVAQTDAETLTGAQRWLLIDFATEHGQAVDGDTEDEALLDCARSLVGWPVGP